MSKNVLCMEGEIRPFTPSEVGFVIKESREAMGLKREALARCAGLAEKTIERAESGVPVRPKSARRIAVALGLAPDEFTKQRFMPHPARPEEVEQQQRQLNEKWAELHVAVTVRELREVSDVIPLLGIGPTWVDDNFVAEEHRPKFKALETVISEANIQAAEHVLARMRDAAGREYVIKGAVVEAYFSDQPGQAVKKKLTSYVVAFQRSRGVRDMTPVEGWFPKMKLLQLHGVAGANEFPGDENTAWTGRDPLGILCGDGSTDPKALW